MKMQLRGRDVDLPMVCGDDDPRVPIQAFRERFYSALDASKHQCNLGV